MRESDLSEPREKNRDRQSSAELKKYEKRRNGCLERNNGSRPERWELPDEARRGV